MADLYGIAENLADGIRINDFAARRFRSWPENSFELSLFLWEPESLDAAIGNKKTDWEWVHQLSNNPFCEDNASCFDIRPTDAKLIEAAKGLGHTLASLSECNEEQRQAITAMLTFLDNLPAAAPPQFFAEYGFDIEPDSVTAETPLSRGWGVYAYRSCLEIGLHYTEAFRDPASDDIDQAFTGTNGDTTLLPQEMASEMNGETGRRRDWSDQLLG